MFETRMLLERKHVLACYMPMTNKFIFYVDCMNIIAWVFIIILIRVRLIWVYNQPKWGVYVVKYSWFIAEAFMTISHHHTVVYLKILRHLFFFLSSSFLIRMFWGLYERFPVFSVTMSHLYCPRTDVKSKQTFSWVILRCQQRGSGIITLVQSIWRIQRLCRSLKL